MTGRSDKNMTGKASNDAVLATDSPRAIYFCRMKSIRTWIGRHLFSIGVVIYGITAWCSEGYHHPDEHFQIIEFANYKLGRTPVADLPWEFSAEIRPALQPMLTYGFLQAAESLGLTNPFTQIFLLRLLTGWLCLWVYFQWSHWLALALNDDRVGVWLRWAVVFLWFMPYLSVRFSSENLAGLALWSGLLLVLKRNNKGLFLAGILLGLSLFLRFQMAFSLLGLGAWLGWQWGAKKPLGLAPGQMGRLLVGGLIALVLGIASDGWLYGKPVFTAFNYFTANILDNKAAQWGVSPWWYYFTRAAFTAVPPISIVGLILAGIGLWKHRSHALVWLFIPFFIAHLVVGHKEMRFLYPMVLPVLIAAVWGWLSLWNADDTDAAQTRIRADGKWHRFIAVVCQVAIVINFVLLPVRCLLAAQEAIPCLRFIYQVSKNAPLAVYAVETSPYRLVGLEMHFYRSRNVQTIVVESFNEVEPAADVLLFSQKLMLETSPQGIQSERVYTYLPHWILQFNPNNWQSRSRIWSVHRFIMDH